MPADTYWHITRIYYNTDTYLGLYYNLKPVLTHQDGKFNLIMFVIRALVTHANLAVDNTTYAFVEDIPVHIVFPEIFDILHCSMLSIFDICVICVIFYSDPGKPPFKISKVNCQSFIS